MTGQGFVLLALGLFTSLVIAAAAVDQYLLREHPPSEVGGLLWRVENTLGRARDVEMDLASTQYGEPPQTVRMTVRAVVGPAPALSVVYVEPESVAGQIMTADHDLLSDYLPGADLVVTRRWSGVPLAAVGLAGLDISRLRSQWLEGSVEARILAASASLAPGALAASMPLSQTLAGTRLDPVIYLEPIRPRPIDPDLSGFGTPATSAYDPLHGSYIVEVRETVSGRLVQTLWIDRTTYFIQKIVYSDAERPVRALEVERVVLDQELAPDDVLALPRASATIRG